MVHRISHPRIEPCSVEFGWTSYSSTHFPFRSARPVVALPFGTLKGPMAGQDFARPVAAYRGPSGLIRSSPLRLRYRTQVAWGNCRQTLGAVSAGGYTLDLRRA